MKYKDWLLEWLTNYVKPSSKARTFRKYKDIVDKRLIPNFGETEMSELTPLILQRYIAALGETGNMLTGKGLASNSINSVITVIQRSFSVACMLGYISSYEMGKLKRPKTVEKEVENFSVAEQIKIEQAVMQDKREKMKGIIICLYTGLRIGELLALEWDNVDLKNAKLYVTKSCHDGKNAEGKYCRITEAPKTPRSRREIPLPKDLMPLLKQMKKASTSALVIMDGEKIPSVRAYQSSFSLLLKKHGIPHHGFHALRHTFATRAIECGVDVSTLSEVLGHKNATVTLERYVHSEWSHKTNMMNRMKRPI